MWSAAPPVSAGTSYDPCEVVIRGTLAFLLLSTVAGLPETEGLFQPK